MFTIRFVRLLFNACVAQQIGPDGVALLTCIAVTEDKAFNSRPVTFFNQQLMSHLGIRKWERLDRIRRECIETGWLNYAPPPNGTQKPGSYFVTIPASAGAFDDLPIDDGGSLPETITGFGAHSNESDTGNGLRSGGRSGVRSGGTINPNPNPSPTSCSEPTKSATEPADGISGFPVKVPKGEEPIWRVPQAKVNEWRETYGCDVLPELRKARQWCQDNPAKRKTPRGMVSFLGRWLSNVNDGRGLTGTNHVATNDKPERILTPLRARA